MSLRLARPSTTTKTSRRTRSATTTNEKVAMKNLRLLANSFFPIESIVVNNEERERERGRDQNE